jgi:ABC-type transport system involved in multi-copper enzyme maturation permease subunit
MEIRTNWKGILIFSFIVILLAGSMPQIFPSILESAAVGLPGEENLELVLPENKGDDISLSWKPVTNTSTYFVLESETIQIWPFNIIYIGNDVNISIPFDFNGTRVYTVHANLSGFQDFSILNFSSLENITNFADFIQQFLGNYKNIFEVFIGMTSTEESGKGGYDDLLDNPAYESLTQGKVTTIYEIRGFISLEFFSWWVLLAGLFFAYFSVSSVTDGFEGKQMDLIFSTPITREQFLLEKFAAMIIIVTFVLLIASGAMAGGIDAIGESDNLDPYTIFLAIIGSLPMLLVIMAFGYLAAFQFRSTRVGMGLAFLFVMVEFILFTVSQLVSSLEYLKYASIMYYWDYNTVMYDGLFKVGDFIGLFVVTGVILVLAVYVFKKKDIPA